MSETTTSNFAGLLVESFSRDRVFAPFERSLAKFHTGTMDWESEEPLGKGRTFGIRTKDAHSTGTVSEANGATPTLDQPEILQANVDAVQMVGACGWTELMISTGRGIGSLGPDVVSDHIDMTTRNVMQLLNRMSLGHGTARLAAVDTTTVTSTTFVCRNPEHLVQLRDNMKIDFYDLDTSGSKQGATETISGLDFGSRTVTIGSSRSLTAGWGVYQALTSAISTYGVAPFGLRAWADDGSLTSTIAGITRSGNPGVNANVIAPGSGTQPYSEKLMRQAVNRIFFACGMQPDEAWCNKGVLSEHLNHLVGDRRFTLMPGENVPKYRIGQRDEEIGFQDGGTFIPFRIDTDLPAREIIFLKKSMFRRHQLRPINWLGDDTPEQGSPAAVLMQLPASGGGYALSKVAILLGMTNYGNRMPKSICRVTAIADEELAGD
jgi:hypothetical protein